jgi:hypothetical protein
MASRSSTLPLEPFKAGQLLQVAHLPCLPGSDLNGLPRVVGVVPLSRRLRLPVDLGNAVRDGAEEVANADRRAAGVWAR